MATLNSPESYHRPRGASMVDIFHPSKINVLLVDDDKISLVLCDRLLKQAKYRVTTATDGIEAIKLLESQSSLPFDLIIVDVYMPRLDGFGLLQKVRSNPEWNGIPVIMISSAQELDIVVKCLRAGADDFIMKPARLESMQTVWQCVYRKKKERKLVTQLTAEQETRGYMQDQLQSLQTQMVEAVETPVNILLRTINELSRTDGLTQEVRDALTNVVRSLSSNNLYRPVMQKMTSSTASADRTTQEWLSSVLNVQTSEELDTWDSRYASISESTETAELREWHFDVWSYKEEQMLGFLYTMFSDFGLLEEFKIEDTKLKSLLLAIRSEYSSRNPYHNFRHAFDVVHGIYVMLTTGKAAENLTPLDILACLFSGLCHDVDHPGTNNPFQIASSSKFALRYNDKSCLENHHCSHAFILMRKPENDICANLTPVQYKEFRQTVIQCILATDLALHTEYGTKFQALIETRYKRDSREDRLLMCTLLVKSADISNACKPLSLAKIWSDVVLEEFFQQGDLEKKCCMPVSPFFDREKKSQGQMSINFIDYIVLPFYQKLVALLPEMGFTLDHIARNREHWISVKLEEDELSRASTENDGSTSK